MKLIHEYEIDGRDYVTYECERCGETQEFDSGREPNGCNCEFDEETFDDPDDKVFYTAIEDGSILPINKPDGTIVYPG